MTQGDTADEYEKKMHYYIATGSDLQIEALVSGLRKIEDCQEVLKYEHQHEERSWVIRKAQNRIKELREYDIID